MVTRVVLSVVLSAVLLQAEGLDTDLEGFDDASTGSVQVASTGSATQKAIPYEDIMDGFDETPTVSGDAKKSTSVDGLMDGFDDASTGLVQVASAGSTAKVTEPVEVLSGLTGKFTEQVAYALYNDAPHEDISSLKTSLLLDYEHKFENGIRLKVNARSYYDAIYSLYKDRVDFEKQELDELEFEVELFDAYVEGKITDTLDYKLGRQVVVWGRSDTIRVTDVLNPLDNRRPGMIDIEDLRLPVTMAKFDYFMGDWRVTPIAIVEQRFSKNPPYGSVFNPSPVVSPSNERYDDVTYALSVGGEFTGWDVNFYAAKIRNDAGQLQLPTVTKPQAVINHDKIEMYGTALNVLTGAWLFKTELAYFDDLKYFSTGDKTFSRTDLLFGFEYKGIPDTSISYDIVTRNMGGYDARLITEPRPLKKNDYQHALRISSDFMNATVTANYLISLYGEKLDEGGFQRAWVKYELGEGINMNAGVVDYIGGSVFFDAIKDNDMVFADISYSF